MDFKKRVNGSWTDTSHYIHNTSTDTFTTLPADVYANDTTATVGLKGNMEQNGTPAPDTPIQPQECGDLETDGAKAGQYKIPISSANTTTPVYLGQVQSTRRIRKLVLTGTNADGEWKKSSTRTGSFYLTIGTNATVALGLCDRAVNVGTIEQYNSIGKMFVEAIGLSKLINLWLFDTNISLDDFKSYLAAQYAAGTPVTVWYVLATPTTGIVNEPLRKIGDYADTVSGISIPTIAGANTLSVDTTLQPSEVTATYKGWHPVTDVHERDSGAWT